MSFDCRLLPRAATAACRLVALAAALALACGRQGTYEVHGLVREVDYTAKQATIEHEDIPGLMSAMTMGFDVPDPAVLAKLQPGERIVFELEVTEKSFRIVSVRNADEAVPRAGASRARRARRSRARATSRRTSRSPTRTARASRPRACAGAGPSSTSSTRAAPARARS